MRIGLPMVVLLMVPACRSSPDVLPEESVSLTVMTFNIRYGTADDGAHGWEHRKELVAGRIQQANPDVLALQEGLDFQLEDLGEVLSDYTKIGQHREGGQRGEFSGLFVRSGLEIRGRGEFWFSDSPEVVGSKSWDSSLPRMCAWVDVVPAQGLDSVRIYGAHFDHRGGRARLRAAQMICAHGAGRERVVAMGDFNATPSDPPLEAFFNEGFRSALQEAAPGEDRGTFNGFHDEQGGRRIDFILMRGGLRANQASILGGLEAGLFPSDHDAVLATLDMQ